MNFTSIELNRDSLQSQVIRNLVGDRVLDLTDSLTDNGNGFFAKLFDFTLKLTGFVVSALFNFVGWSLTELWDLIVDTYFEVKYFDWNQTDKEIKQQLEQNDVVISSALGALTGTSLVWLAGVGVSAGLVFKFPVVSAKIALALSEEGGQEIRGALTNLILTTRNVIVENFIMTSLLTIRKYKLFNQEPVLTEKKPWTIAEKIDEAIESINSNTLKAFVNSLYESVEDSVIEMGYVIAYTLDDHFASQVRANESVLGQNRTVELTPNVDVPDERIIISGPQELTTATVQNAVTHHQLIDNRDVGQIEGLPTQDISSPLPQRRSLKIIFKSVKIPPWKEANGSRAKNVQVTVPDVKQGITWVELKQFIKKYTWGEHYVTARLTSRRKITVFGVSEAEAKQQIETLVNLSNSDISTINSGQQILHLPQQQKLPTLVYPAYCKLVKGDINAEGEIISNQTETTRVNLWLDEEPDDFTVL